jgi:hypothetical protein
MLPVDDLREKLKAVMANTPYNDSQLTLAREPNAPSIIPREVGAGSPVEHIIYIIKENRTYGQVLAISRKQTETRGSRFSVRRLHRIFMPWPNSLCCWTICTATGGERGRSLLVGLGLRD